MSLIQFYSVVFEEAINNAAGTPLPETSPIILENNALIPLIIIAAHFLSTGFLLKLHVFDIIAHLSAFVTRFFHVQAL